MTKEGGEICIEIDGRMARKLAKEEPEKLA